ncbi:ribosomal protection-like ABC-F family protein [Halocella sp. SP3-1]|uniref:ribosomal protection-like ABC-F family protein n=1 Tax=Halocella sp. SP3-1 TaxID=2382161 RepID=UPI000F7532D4|nr:ABC-F type ribosomal protection protein [Halocella sp. SP3-1]AZO94493.1 ABC-F type ribosomal protection protein [Halocella sp. SP3-1]
MLLIETKEVNKWIGARQLLKDISFNMYQGDKVGFVGRNGTGKSTLLKIISGQDKEYQGQIIINTRVGYLPQYYNYPAVQTVEEFFTEVSYDYGSFLRLMKEFGFETDFLDRQIGNCSGGEQTKLQLIRLLIKEPALLILDEPTNHLDIEARDWLANFLNKFQGGVILVSHDRYFLDQVVKEVWELEDAELKEYTGNYSDYQKQREVELEREKREYQKYHAEKKSLKAAIQKQQQFVNKADKGRKKTDSFWKQLKGSDRRTGRMAKRVDSLRSQLEQLDKKEKPFEYKEINPEFENRELHSQIIIQGKGVGKSFQSEPVFKDLNFTISRGSKIALLGKNGIGKTILLKLILGQQNPTTGEIFRTRALEIGYFSQKMANLHGQDTVLKELQEKLPDRSEELIRTFLGSMLFKGEDVFKKIGDLSIGERVRVAFTILLLSKANFLLLDEPLNHLDIVSRERIEAALKEYPGSFLIVTHDRYFARKIANEIWELTNNGLDCFQGNYNDFLKYKQGEFKVGLELEDELIKMKRAELIARLEQARDAEEIARIESQLDQL